MQEHKRPKQLLLVGNPNVGKSTLFNSLCNRNQKTGNYAGVTVASLTGNYTYKGEDVEITDLPGSYSIYPTSADEAIFSRYLIQEEGNYAGVLYIADAINMKRSMLMFQQLQDLEVPILIVINQIDEAEKRGIKINIEKLSKKLNVHIVRTNAKEHLGIEELRESIFTNQFKKSSETIFEIPMDQKELVTKISEKANENNLYKIWTQLAADSYFEKNEKINDIIIHENAKFGNPKRLQIQETIRRYQFLDKIISECTEKKVLKKQLITEKIDKILVHYVWGYLFFFIILLLLFQSVFFLAEYPMSWIESFFSWLSTLAEDHIPEGPVNSLVSKGVLPGIGGIVVFAPQIGILLYFLYLLEDSGYMARVIFLMDRILRPFGLNGKSIVPLVSGTACAIPAIMSTRSIENIKERLITILATPFMTCSARLPIYSIIIGLIISDGNFYGIKYRALALMAMYFLGFAMSLVASTILNIVIKTKVKSFLIMDLPAYKLPMFGYDFKMVLGKVWDFITNSGKVIFTVSIILWTLSYFGPAVKQNETLASDVKLENSYLGKIGHIIEPVIAPLGFEWKTGIGILTSFAAREVFVGTLSTLYSLDVDAPEGKLIEKMRLDVHPNGEKVFGFANGVSILLFYAFAMQCVSTIAVVYKETQSLKLTLLQSFAMTALAYFSSLFIYQILR